MGGREMALKEARGSLVRDKKVAPVKKKASGDTSEALIEFLQKEDLTGLSERLKVFVAPLRDEKLSRTELHKLAKQFVPFLVRILKLCFVNAANVPVAEEAQGRGDEVFKAVEIALDGLDSLRSFITGSPFEIEIQRCSFVRRLLAWRRHSAALVQCRKNFSSLCLNLGAPVENGSCNQKLVPALKGQSCAVATANEKKRAGQRFVLPHPKDVELTSGLPTLVCGIVTDLIWCTGESAPTSAESYLELLFLPRQLQPWLTALDADAAGKQKDTLYKGLYKCVSVLVANPVHYGDHLVREFSILTLRSCAASSSWKQYVKVAYKLAHSLSYHGTDNIRLGLDVSQAAMNASHEMIELHSLWTDAGMLELVDCYARLCQTGKYFGEGSAFLCDLVHEVKRLSPSVAAILGFYVIGLRFCSDVVDLDSACHHLLRDGTALLESCLQTATDEDRRKYTFSLLKSFELVKKNSSKHIQSAWGSSIKSWKAVPTTVSDEATLNCSLRRVLHLWYQMLSRASDFRMLTREEDGILKQVWSQASAPLVSLLRLSLMLFEGVQDCATCMDVLLKRGSLQIDELRWLMASVSNIGIQIFNMKDYESAFYPFKIAYDAAWAMVELSMKQTLSQPADSQVKDFMLDYCAKCVALADTLKRSGKFQAGFDVLSDGLTRWATVHSKFQSHLSSSPSSLVRTFVKMLHTGDSATLRSGTHRHACLYNLLKTRCETLHHRTVGVLLEEELSVLHDLETQGLDNIQAVKELIFESLLDEVYIEDKFPVERCTILLERGRLARLKGVHDFASFSEVLTILTKTLKDALEKGVDGTHIASVENLLAMAYCAQAFCAYESDAAGQEYLGSVLSALSVWEDSARAGRTWIGLDTNGDARMFGQDACCGSSLLRLLLNVHDLLALKGYSVVQSRVQQLIVSFLCSARTDMSPKLFSSLWANTRFSHVLCPVPYPENFFTFLTQKIGVAGNSLQFWEDCAVLCPGSSLNAEFRFMHCKDHSEGHDKNVEGFCQAFEAVEKIAISEFRSSPKSSGAVFKLAVLFHMLAKYALDEGKLRVACKYAKEALNLRRRLASRMFHAKYRGSAFTDSESDSAECEARDQSKKNAGRFHILDSVAARAWPKLSTHAKPVDFEPNPWRVLGDYVESLMQIGVISEKMGAADDALASFSEGYSVSLAQNLPFAQAAFKSCLGEVRRKRHQWEAAENDLRLAKGAYENLESALVCSCCSLTGKAVVCLRLGDLARRYRQGENPALDGVLHHQDAFSLYVAARKSLTAVLNAVNEGCECTGCRYPGRSEDDNCNLPSSTMPATLGSKTTPVFENHEVIILDSGPEPVVMDLTTTFSNLNLEPTEGKHDDVKAPGRRNSRRKPVDDELTSRRKPVDEELTSRRPDPVQPKRLVEKRSTRSGRPKVQETDATLESAPPRKLVNAGKAVRKRTATKRSKAENDEIIVIDDDPLADSKQDGIDTVMLERQVQCATSTSGRKEPISCVLREAYPSAMDKWAAYKWVRHCHQHLTRILVQIGKCHEELGHIDKVVEIYEHASYLLGIPVGLLIPCSDYASYSFACQGHSLFALEEAAYLYHKSLLQLRRIQTTGGEGTQMEFALPMNWLVHAYSLSTQAPPLLRKISALLSILHVPVACGGLGLLHNLDLSCMRERAAFFHQVSIGAVSRQQHLAVLDSKLLNLVSEGTEDPAHVSFTQGYSELQKALAVSPLDLRTDDLSISRLVQGLSSNTLCCVSLVEKELASLLKQREPLDGHISLETSVWVLITRYTEAAGSLSVLLAAKPLADDDDYLSETSGSSSTCPYNIDEAQDSKLASVSSKAKVLSNSRRNSFQTSLQDIASAFTTVLDESRLSTSGDIDIDTVEEKRQWWRWRLALDTRLLQILMSMENTWLGHWKSLLVAEPDSASIQDSLQSCSKELGSWLRSSYGIRNKGEDHWNTYDALVGMLLQGVGNLSEDQVKQGISTLHKFMESFLDQVRDLKHGRIDSIREKGGPEEVERFQEAFLKLMPKKVEHVESASADIPGRRRTRKSKKETSNGDSVGGPSEAGSDVVNLDRSTRNSMMLVLDSELQGLPWESLPVLRGFETYRMPSVGGIRALFAHQQLASATSSSHMLMNKNKRQAASQIEHLRAGSVSEPSVDPYNTYYVLNPSGDLAKTQEAFEDWFKENLGWEGKVGVVPTIEEYVAGLQKHDLYTYLGHGSGEQYLPERFVRRLDRCAASLLMGCSSGRFSPRGDYEPVGVPLSYLMAGCPAAIANLWDVTDGDIDRFSRFLLHKWLGTPNDVNSLTFERNVGNSKHDVINHDKLLDSTKARDSGMRSKMGSFIGEGRELCRLPYLIGASPVYYGVPTCISRKEIN